MSGAACDSLLQRALRSVLFSSYPKGGESVFATFSLGYTLDSLEA